MDNNARIVKTFHLNGLPAEEYSTLNDVKHGYYKSWYTNGQLASEMNYFNGNKVGFCAQWNPDGKLIEIYHCENNYMVGDYIKWNEDDGSLSGHYKFNEKGHVDGLNKHYTHDKIVMIRDYDDGRLKECRKFQYPLDEVRH